MPTIKKLMLNGVAYKFKTSPIPLGEGILQENGMETRLENGNYIDFEVPTPVYPTESIVYTMSADSNGKLYVGTAGFKADGSYGQFYNWNISVNWGTLMK